MGYTQPAACVGTCVSPLGASSLSEELCADCLCPNPPVGALTWTSQSPPVMVNMNGPSHTESFSVDRRGKAQSPSIAEVSKEPRSARHINTVTVKDPSSYQREKTQSWT